MATAVRQVPSIPSQGSADHEETDELDELRGMISHTKGYFARDWSLSSGWNNMRYTVEAALEQSRLLNRTLILPSFVYARACEGKIELCSTLAPTVKGGDAMHSNIRDTLPPEQQIAYRVPIDIMIDIPHLRRSGHPVVLTSEFLRLSGFTNPEVLETTSGHFDRDKYLGVRPTDGKNVTLFVVKNNEYDLKGSVARVDRVQPLVEKFGRFSLEDVGTVSRKLWEKVNDKADHTTVSLEEAREAVRLYMDDPDNDHELEDILGTMGWVVLHTWDGWLGMDWLETVVQPVKRVAPLRSIRGWHDDYNYIDHDVVLLEGNFHSGRKPGTMFFTTPEARDAYAKIVLDAVRPIDKIRRLGDHLAENMRQRVGGRMWMAAHIQPGNFVQAGLVAEQSIEDHLIRINEHLANGSFVLHNIHERRGVTTSQVPNVVPDLTQFTREPPKAGDPFFLGTDERSPNYLNWLKRNNAILVSDLLSPQDRLEFGWPIMITDVLGLIEQVVLSHSYYFYAHPMNSCAGGVVNMRAKNGKDWRTSWVD
ncbi:hypothetical protein FRB90_002332 [Tulasnella sp. 427]|nr:hypothetical protein FRB90_002332 [Tulasnella sp. 427]